MYCKSCGVALPEHATQACPACGAAVAKSHTKLILIIVAAVGCLGMLPVMAIVAAIAIPNLIEARKHGNEAAAIGALKTVTTAQALFREADKEEDGEFDYGDLRELSDARLIDAILGSGTKQGYLFQVEANPTTPEFLWFATASPVVPGTTGSRYFGVNQAGVIYYSELGPVEFDAECNPVGSDVRPVGR